VYVIFAIGVSCEKWELTFIKYVILDSLSEVIKLAEIKRMFS